MGSKRGVMRSVEAEKAIPVTAMWRRLGEMVVHCQASILLGRLKTLSPGGAAAG